MLIKVDGTKSVLVSKLKVYVQCDATTEEHHRIGAEIESQQYI